MRNYLLPSLVLALATTFSSVPAFAATPPASEAGKMAEMAPMSKVNLNTADQDTLQRELTGIGGAKAAAIVEHRQSKGAFASVDELLEVQGIGKALVEKNRDRLTIE
ncbi:MAG: helix-hairpin-helix domain-containing protein [Janthinobacterium lividum]|uniref:ComEA family DNA-binding protein n=1 Tax=Pseudomonas TaxID=286 RepID=UPI001CFB579B|nr:MULTISPECIES: ComEA family DNA-binding protein [Pseudomonas]